MKCRTININDPPPIVITLFDYDKFGSPDYIGCCILDFNTWRSCGNIYMDNEQLPPPKWSDV